MKYFKLFICFIFSFFLFRKDCLAINDNTRSRDNLLVPSDVNVLENNINDILRTPAVDSKEKIYDFSSKLTSQENKKLKDKINDFIKNTRMDVSIVITNDLLGFSIDEYSKNFYDYNDFLDEGVILVIYLNDDEPEIYMGNNGLKDSDIFNIFTDERINQILSYIYKDIENKNYNKAIDDYINILDGFYRLNGNLKVSSEGKIIKIIPWIEIIIIALSITFIIDVLLILKVNRNKKRINLEEKIDKSSLIIKNCGDKLISNNVSN